MLEKKQKYALLFSGLFLTGIFVCQWTIPQSVPVVTQKMDLQYAADFSNDDILVGASHNIFVAKVLRQVGTQERGIGPETQFEVQVIDNIKGNLQETVVVDQQGGYVNGVLYAVGDDTTSPAKDSDSYLLQPGSTYLLATRYNKEENWYTLNPYPTASKLLNSNPATSLEQLEVLADSDSRVQALKEAYPHEILLDADVKSDNALNSYKATQITPEGP